MAIAFQVISKQELDASVAACAQGVRDNLILAVKLKALVDLQSDETLAAQTYSVDDIYLLRLIAQDLKGLADVATGAATVSDATNFLQHSNSILGLH